MREVTAIPGKEIFLGRCGENNATCVVFDLSEWQRIHGDGVVQLLHQRNGDKQPYPCVIEQRGSCVTWCITNSDVAAAGRGRVELQYYVGDTLAKSETCITVTERALGKASETPPAPYEGWMEKMLGMASETEVNADAAAQSAAQAKASEESAEDSKRLADSYKRDAKAEADRAATAANTAEVAKSAAAASASAAAASETGAASKAEAANAHANRAEAARNSIVLDEEKIAQAEARAAANASAAAISANSAAVSAGAAEANKNAAATSASNAATSAADANRAASNAATSAASVGNAAKTATAAAETAASEADRAKIEADRAASVAGGDFVAKSGDTMTGPLQLKPTDSEGYAKIYKNASADGDYGLQMQDVDPDGNFMGLTLSGKLQKLEFKKKRAGDSEYRYTKLYDTDNPPNAYEVGALPIGGGVLQGDFQISTDCARVKMAATASHHAELMKNADSENDYGTILRDTNGEAVAELKLSASNKNVKLAHSGKEYVLFHEGNIASVAVPTVSTVITDWNDARKNGWYVGYEGAANSPDSRYAWVGHVSNLNEDIVFQEVYAIFGINNYLRCTRFLYPGAGTPWEWDTPAMEVGVEYRTTERYLGKPVYVKAVNVGLLPNSSYVSVNITTNSDGTVDETIRAISAHGLTGGGFGVPTPAYGRDPSKRILVQPYVWLLFIGTNFDASGETANIVVKYTKTTD